MPRLFVAIDLPDPAKRALSALGQGLAGVRWLSAEHLHLTIRFIGEVDDALASALREGLTGQNLAPFVCRLQGVGRFPPKGRPRVLWAGVQAEEGLMRLQRTVELAVRGVGLAPEEREPRFHITLTRLKDMPSAPIAEYLTRHERFQTEPFTIQAFHLYSSLLTAKGAIHTRVQTYPLLLQTTL
jgi:2'-5' RNA ligase